MAIRSVLDIARVLKERKDIKAKEGIIIWMFMRYLENLGLKRGVEFDIEVNHGEVDLDLVIYDEQGKPAVVIDVIEPSYSTNLRNENFLRLVEKVLVRSYVYALKPEYVVVTDGFSLLSYDKNGSRIEHLSTHDLANEGEEFENNFRSILLGWNNKI